jgi:hypothetical protein
MCYEAHLADSSRAKSREPAVAARCPLGATYPGESWTRGSPHQRARSFLRNDSPLDASFFSRRLVQSQSQHAQGSVPFSCRQFRRECASFTDNSSKYSSQYGRSSARGGSQKHVSTQRASPFASTRAFSIFSRYSSPAIDPRPSVPSAIALASAAAGPDLTRAFTK